MIGAEDVKYHSPSTLFCSRCISSACLASLSLPSLSFFFHLLCSSSSSSDRPREGCMVWRSCKSKKKKSFEISWRSCEFNLLFLILTLSWRALVLDSNSSRSARLSASSSCKWHTSRSSSSFCCCQPISTSDSMVAETGEIFKGERTSVKIKHVWKGKNPAVQTEASQVQKKFEHQETKLKKLFGHQVDNCKNTSLSGQQESYRSA